MEDKMKNSGKEKPLVSICCITYNHAKYIRDALDGFMMQETDFPFEVLIHDDASTDGTADIIREYEKKYPGIIKPIYQTENQYSKGVKISTTYNYPRAQGKYIALCEGDDFWTDRNKLKKQVQYMEENSNITICAHARKCLNTFNKMYYKDRRYDLKGLSSEDICHKLLLGEIIFGTQTLLVRTSTFFDNMECYSKLIRNAPMGDMQLIVIMTFFGKASYLPDYMATYRVHSASVSHFGDEIQGNIFVKKAALVHCDIANEIGHKEWSNEIRRKYQLTTEYSGTDHRRVIPVMNKTCAKIVYWKMKRIYLRLRYMLYDYIH